MREEGYSEQGYSEQGIEHFVKESEANRTSPNAAAEHAVQLVAEKELFEEFIRDQAGLADEKYH